jgi:hypothetical protein
MGSAGWDRVGRALYMADFLEPGRNFMRADRAFLAEHLPHDFDGVFRQVVRMRLEWTLREGKAQEQGSSGPAGTSPQGNEGEGKGGTRQTPWYMLTCQ